MNYWVHLLVCILMFQFDDVSMLFSYGFIIRKKARWFMFGVIQVHQLVALRMLSGNSAPGDL